MAKVLHFDASFGLSSATSCERSFHSYIPEARRPEVTEKVTQVTCKRCYDVLEKQKNAAIQAKKIANENLFAKAS